MHAVLYHQCKGLTYVFDDPSTRALASSRALSEQDGTSFFHALRQVCQKIGLKDKIFEAYRLEQELFVHAKQTEKERQRQRHLDRLARNAAAKLLSTHLDLDRPTSPLP
jgi:hypothetical protein